MARRDVRAPNRQLEGRIRLLAFEVLAAFVAGLGFFEWREEYAESITDLPLYTLTVDRNGHAKSVHQYGTREPVGFCRSPRRST